MVLGTVRDNHVLNKSKIINNDPIDMKHVSRDILEDNKRRDVVSVLVQINFLQIVKVSFGILVYEGL